MGILLLAAVGGAAWWTLLEYLLHRFAFHTNNPLFGRRHLAHHARLQERLLAIAPPASSVGGAAIHLALFWALFGRTIGLAAFAGFFAGYLAYEWVHFSTHYRVPKTRPMRWLRSYHLLHHHKSPRARFGVTSPVWDVVFGTYAPKPKVGRPAPQPVRSPAR